MLRQLRGPRLRVQRAGAGTAGAGGLPRGDSWGEICLHTYYILYIYTSLDIYIYIHKSLYVSTNGYILYTYARNRTHIYIYIYMCTYMYYINCFGPGRGGLNIRCVCLYYFIIVFVEDDLNRHLFGQVYVALALVAGFEHDNDDPPPTCPLLAASTLEKCAWPARVWFFVRWKEDVPNTAVPFRDVLPAGSPRSNLKVGSQPPAWRSVHPRGCATAKSLR